VVDTDELPKRARPDKIPQLKPAFSKDGRSPPPTRPRFRTARRLWC